MNGFDTNKSTVTGHGDDPALTALLRESYAAPAEPAYWSGFEQRVLAHVQDSQLLVSAYAAPTDASYWAGLEQRVMQRVRDRAQLTWWAVLPEWRGLGMIAAAAALFLVGATTVMRQQADAVAQERAALQAELTLFDNTIEPVNMAISPTSPNTGRRSTAPERYLDLIRP